MNNFILTYVRFIKVTLFYKQIFRINTVLNGELNSKIQELQNREWFVRKISKVNSTSASIFSLSDLRTHFKDPSATQDNFMVTAENGDGSVAAHIDGVTFNNGNYYAVFDRTVNQQIRIYAHVIYFPDGAEKL